MNTPDNINDKQVLINSIQKSIEDLKSDNSCLFNDDKTKVQISNNVARIIKSFYSEHSSSKVYKIRINYQLYIEKRYNGGFILVESYFQDGRLHSRKIKFKNNSIRNLMKKC